MSTHNTLHLLSATAGCLLAASLGCVGTAAASAAPSVASDPPVRTCTVNDLRASMRVHDGAAGTSRYILTFRNASSTPCKLDGHPGVSAVGGGNGTQIGASAKRTSEPTSPKVLIPNGTTTAWVDAVNIGDDGGPLGATCRAVKADGWRIYPPDSTKAMFVAQKGMYACANPKVHWLTVSVVNYTP